MKLRQLVQEMGNLPSDFVLGCKLGAMRQGFLCPEDGDMDVIVHHSLPGSDFFSVGTDFVIYNTDGRKNITLKVKGVTAVPCGLDDVDLFWSIFELDYRGASQSAASPDGGDFDLAPVGFVVGILSTPISFTSGNMTRAKKREIFRKSLDLLADAHFDEWHRDFPVARLLVGNCNMSEDDALACVQDTHPQAASVQEAHPANVLRARALRSWQLFPPFFGLTGDLFAVMGCTCQPRNVPIDHSDFRHDEYRASLSIPYQIIPGTASNADDPDTDVSSDLSEVDCEDYSVTRAFRCWRHNVSGIIVYNRARYAPRTCSPCHSVSQPVAGIEGDALSCDLTLAELLETVTGAHCLIAHFLGPNDFWAGLPHVEVYALRRTCVRVWRVSWYDALWLRSWSWLCLCRGPYENECGCAIAWRHRGWVCPRLLRWL